MNCKICNKNFSGIECFQQHEASDKHRRKLMSHNATFSNSAASSALNPTASNGVLNQNTFPCTTCAMTFQTLTGFIEHTGSEEHARMILLKKNTEIKLQENIKIGSRDFEADSSTQDIPVNDDFKAMASWQSRCEKCDKNFSGREPYQQHIDSLAHKKKCGLLPTSEIEVELPPSVCGSYFCEICRIPLSGPEPYRDHMRGKSHQKKVLATSKSGNDDMKENTTPKLMGVIHCEACDKTFTGPICYEQHLAGEGHKKVVGRNCDLNKLSAKENNSVKPSALPLSWNCEVCDIQCSGVLPYRAHLASKGHHKKMVRTGAVSKQNELKSLFLDPTSNFEGLNHASSSREGCDQVDGAKRNENPTTGGLEMEVKKYLYGDGWDAKILTPSDLNLACFAVGEPIDFDKSSKIKIDAKDLDMVDIKEEENEEMDE